MRKLWIVGILALFLTGCSAQETFETVGDVLVVQTSSHMQQVLLSLPDDVITPVLESQEAGKLYLCEDYMVTVHTMPAGDMQSTIKTLTGYTPDALTVMETVKDGVKRYECVWTAAGEGEDQVGRAVILDDGSYHYAVTVMADASAAGELTDTWQEIFGTFRLVPVESVVSTGS